LAARGAATALLGDGLIGRHYIMAMRQPALLDVIETTLRFRQAGTARLVVTGPARERDVRHRHAQSLAVQL
jgi:two-component system phosphate regulon sensor histidine kinase PhoR